MKKLHIALAAIAALSLSSCNDWLKEEAPGTNRLDDFFTSGAVAIQTVNACYAPVAWEYNPGGYFSEWYIGDIASDDALKGGQDVADDANAYDIDNFKVNIQNGILLNYYRAKYQGIIRCNLALQEVAKVEPDEHMTEARKDCLLGEAYFMRALYYFQLVRVFGGVPMIDFVIDSSSAWQQPRATAEEVYDHIISDLKEAENRLWNKSAYPATDLGRATKGAAQAMLCKVYLYMKEYSDAYDWGKLWVNEQYGKEYRLMADYEQNFTLAGENGSESVFEIQYMEDPTSDYGEGFGFSRGTFSSILCRPRASEFGGKSSNKGWGFNHPTQNLLDEFEYGDPRRDLTVGQLGDEISQEVEVNYLGNPYYNYKLSYLEAGLIPSLSHDSRGPLNYRLMRASDVLLLFAEAALESGKSTADAKWALEEVRARARAMASDAGVLPAFPYGSYADNTDCLRQAIRHEGRVELGMEGLRWFDLVRWGIAYEVL
ncbi:MAG: RagB/SusD family nutrient uptake outer membrane protein, partial [Muribaculaceae bacterium]|nr:RagB/SusD family nutrient uptake outer membrane protein [Muribaculaceae bacterium]